MRVPIGFRVRRSYAGATGFSNLLGRRAAPYSSLVSAAEQARQRYRPDEVRVLFVGESAPAGGASWLARAVRGRGCAAEEHCREDDSEVVFWCIDPLLELRYREPR